MRAIILIVTVLLFETSSWGGSIAVGPAEEKSSRGPASVEKRKPKKSSKRVALPANPDTRRKRDARVNEHILDAYKEKEASKGKVEIENASTRPLKEVETYREPPAEFLYMDQEVIHIPERADTFRYEPHAPKTPDAEILKDMSEDQTQGRQLAPKETFDENSLREETFTIKNQKRRPSGKPVPKARK